MKALTKTTNCTRRDKKVEGYDKNFSGLCAGLVPPRPHFRICSGITEATVSTRFGNNLLRVNHPAFIQANSAWPSSVGRCSEYMQWLLPRLGRNVAFCVAVGAVTRTLGILAEVG